MEESLTSAIWSGLDLKETSPRQLSPLVLAYIGDSVYDLIIKTKIVTDCNMQVNKMNKKASSLVKAETQSRIIGALAEYLTEEEDAIYKRGRNAKSYTSAKNASISDYRRATGFEALMGYLYLEKKYDRMVELVKIGIQSLDAD